MDEFSYLSVLLSVILGLAVTQILKGFRAILLSRARIRIYFPVIAWAALLLLICTQHWWLMFGLRNRHDWTFQQFAMVLLNAVLIYMVAGLVFPDFFGEEVVDLKENFLCPSRLAFLARFRNHCGKRVQNGRPRWPTAGHNESDIPRHLRRDVIDRRTDAPGVVSQDTGHLFSAAFVLYIVLLYARIR